MSNLNKESLLKAQSLVGEVSPYDLRHVECFLGDEMGVFVPSTGFCEYAIKERHTHPGYSFIIYPFNEGLNERGKVPEDYYFGEAMSPLLPHEEKREEVFHRYFAFFVSKGFYEQIYKEYDKGKVPRYNRSAFIIHKDIMFYLKKFMYAAKYDWTKRTSKQQALESLMVHLIVEALLEVKNEGVENVQDFAIQKVIAYIHQNYNEKLSIECLAKRINQAPSTFIKKFKKEMNETPAEYLIKVRLQNAQQLLEQTDDSITQIALSCGFYSSSHFSSAFARHMGISPKEYRRIFR